MQVGSSSGEGSTFLKTALLANLTEKAAILDPRIPILIRGEEGVGKDTLARLIHDASARRLYPFIKVNCANLRVDGCEADLFGHEKGNESRAIRRRVGSFEFANRGTIYLDRLECLPGAMIPKLLRVLRTGEISRVGSEETRVVDVRIIASALDDPATTGHWPQLGPLETFEITLPPLRQRQDEISTFASFFLDQFNRRYKRAAVLCPDVIGRLAACSWPGNLPELAHAVHRLVVMGETSLVH